MIRTNIRTGEYSNIFEYPNIRHTLVPTEVTSLTGSSFISNVNSSHKDPGSPFRSHKEFCEIVNPQTSQLKDVLDLKCQIEEKFCICKISIKIHMSKFHGLCHQF